MSASLALKILVADDTLVNRRLMSNFLEKLGHKVILAENGQQAVDLFFKDEPDLVFMDVVMPGMNGLEATSRIKELSMGRWVPVLIVSSLEKPEQLAAGLDAGADDYLPKPLNFRVLEAKMRSIERTLELQQRVVGTLRRTKAITDHMLDALITMDESGTITFCNPAASRLFGYEKREMVGQNVHMLVSEPSRDTQGEFLKDYAANEASSARGDRLAMGKRRGGELFPIQIGISELVLDGEKNYIGILRDISERHEAERKLRENADRLQRYHDAVQEENILAREIMQKQLHRPGLNDPHITYGVEAAEHFSGDLAAARRSPQGRLYAMLADATGHGLAAAISGLPSISVFYGMSGRNLPLSLMVSEMNTTLRQTMASGRFLGVALACVDEVARTVEVWNGGMPDLLWLDAEGRLVHRFVSRQLPMGILPSDAVDVRPEIFTWQKDGQLVICSDGVLEAENADGEPFGIDRLLETLRAAPARQSYAAIHEALNRHLAGESAKDDASIMVVDCITEARPIMA